MKEVCVIVLLLTITCVVFTLYNVGKESFTNSNAESSYDPDKFLVFNDGENAADVVEEHGTLSMSSLAINDADGLWMNGFDKGKYDGIELRDLSANMTDYKTISLVYNITEAGLMREDWKSLALGGFMMGKSPLPENVPGKELLSGHSNEPWNGGVKGGPMVHIPEIYFRQNPSDENSDYLNPWWVMPATDTPGPFGVASGPTSMVIGNHLVVMKISVIDYRSTTNHKLRVEVWYDDFSKLNSGTSSNMFEVSFSKTHDSLNLKVQEDGNIIRLSSKVKKYQNGAFIENVEEREIDMGPPVFTDLSNNDALNIYRVILRPGYEWLYASAGSNGLGMMKRHSKLPKFGRVGPNVVTYSIDEAESVESFYLNGGLILSRNIMEGETPAFNRGLQGLVLSTKAGADGVTTTDGPEYNISTGKDVYLTGIKLYTKALNEAEVFSTYYEYLTDSEKVEFCDDKFEGEINGLKEDKEALEDKIDELEEVHAGTIQLLNAELDDAKRQRDLVGGDTIRRKVMELDGLETDEYSYKRKVEYLRKRNDKQKETNKRLKILLLVVGILFVLGMLIGVIKKGKGGEWLSGITSYLGYSSGTRTNYDYRENQGPTGFPSMLGRWTNRIKDN
tara:strand:- start:10258 stop:12114 length:1857 start_codon:yes stop_codon:yes gene_type:complete